MALSLTDLGADVFSGFTDLNSFFGFAFNFVLYIGWGMTFIGLAYVFYAVIQKLMNTDNEEAAKEFIGAITKACIIVVLGLLLISAQAATNIVGSIFGIHIELKPPF